MAKSIKILSIDDSKAVHAFLDRAFMETSHHLVHVYSGAEGLAVLSQENSGIELVFLDWEMPEMDGPEVLKKIRGSGNSVPVIMVTSKNNPESILEMMQAGASEYIMKPFTPDLIFEKIESVFSGN